MTVTHGPLDGIRVIQPAVFRDARGFFLETYHEQRYRAAGIDVAFVQDNFSRSSRHTIRGLHMQVTSAQAKLVRVVAGAIFDVAVDARPASPTFGRWFGIELSAENFTQLFVPAGFAHGFAVTSEIAEIEYKCSAFYDPADEVAIRYDDPAVGIAWPVTSPVLSARDASAPTLAEVRGRL